jgi:hypothetical protein
MAAARAVCVGHHHIAAEADQRLDPPVEGRDVEVLAGDELEPGRSEWPLVDAYRRRAGVGQEFHSVNRVRWHRFEQHVPARDVQTTGQGV